MYLPKDLQQYLHIKIPITQAMGIQVTRLDAQGLGISAPLALNINDKYTAFGGSLAAIMTVTGWGLTHALIQQAGATANTLVYQTQITYLNPVTQDIYAWCQLPDKAIVDLFLDHFFQRGKARWELQVQVLTVENTVAVQLTGGYVALKTN
ncbi:YiiD C-terminal domain-containing protein [Beggiatoa leptomitoformis]|uniref:Thioesterase n=1 Tax=Beggiatoa leptomitoformis TaxID=288004 RepID=A0A2N9YGQ3_9GAMM|nr:YiiD C-terminal domain-containing protein [Beggiatoa leptomitoformis]ALG68301.1 thioesterase [Beggiatoa leptomitoformis]AUI69386.1 thioesterase [Beggiatoa leptomitoformis]